MHRVLKVSVATAGLVALTAVSAAASVGTSPRACATVNDRVNAVVVKDGTAYLGGRFTSVTDTSGRQLPRNRLAAIDTATCQVLAWSPGADAEVLALAVSSTTVYAGGSFTVAGGRTQPRLVALDRGTGAASGFAGAPNNTVRTLALAGNRLFAGGDFSRIGTATRNSLASFALDTRALDTGWKPAAQGKVFSVTPSSDGARLFVGGPFTALGGDTRAAYLGAVNLATGGVDTSFLPRPGFPVLDVAADSRGVYAGGGGAGGHLGIWNLNGTLQRPVYQTDGGVQNVAVDGDSLYAGGHFTNYCVGNTGSGSPFICDKPLSRRKAFEISLSTGALTSWAPVLNSAHGIFAADVDLATHDLWVGGDFTKVNGKSVARLAVFP